MNTFPFNLPNTKPISRTSSKDAINPVVNIFSPEQSSDIEITTSWVEEKSSNISEWPATSLIQERPKVPTPQQESQPKFSEAETHHQSPYFTDQLKIKDSKAADKLVNQEENHSSVTNLEQNIGTSDHSSIGSRNIGGCRKPREVGTYDAHLVEKEFENLVHQLNLKRQHDAKTFQHFSESLRMKTEAIIDSLDQKFKTRYALVDKKLNKAGNELMAEVEKGLQMEGDLNALKTRVASILQHLQMLTDISVNSGELLPPSPNKSQNV